MNNLFKIKIINNLFIYILFKLFIIYQYVAQKLLTI